MGTCIWCHRPIAKTLQDWSLSRAPISSAPAALCGVHAANAALDLLGGVLSFELPSNSKTRQHRDCDLAHVFLFNELVNNSSQLLRVTMLTAARPTSTQVCLLLGDKPEDSKIVKLTDDDWQDVHTGAFRSARVGDRFALLG